MKIKFLAAGNAPDSYSFSGDVITATYRGAAETFDFSSFDTGAVFDSIELEVLPLIYTHVIPSVKRIDGELYVTLCQKAGAGHWVESDWLNAEEYNPQTKYILEVNNG